MAEARRLAGLRVLFGAVQLNPRGLISTGVVPLNLRGLSETGCNGAFEYSEPVTVTATLRLPTSTYNFQLPTSNLQLRRQQTLAIADNR